MKISMKLVCQYMANFFNLPPTSSHLRPLKVENCDSNSRLVVDEDDNGKFRLERVKVPLSPCNRYTVHVYIGKTFGPIRARNLVRIPVGRMFVIGVVHMLHKLFRDFSCRTVQYCLYIVTILTMVLCTIEKFPQQEYGILLISGFLLSRYCHDCAGTYKSDVKLYSLI